MNNQNPFERTDARVLFIDMNSFFASCEQQTNYWLRNRPVGVCVYTGQYGCVIAPSIEAKKKGVKTGMRLNNAIKICPDLVPLETNPARYRDFHVKIMNVLKQYSDDVVPKSIDEAVVDLTNYGLVYKDMLSVAQQIKKDISEKVGEWLKCSIGIAPNAFLAKLASDIQKPDGLTFITHDNIDSVLTKLSLTDLPGIGERMATRLRSGGIQTPLELRYSSPENLRAICRSVIGIYWYHRLNFSEVDNNQNTDYKTMQAMRHVSAEQRKTTEGLRDILLALCLTLERRMAQRNIFCQTLGIVIKYENDTSYEDMLFPGTPMQDGIELFNAIHERMDIYKNTHKRKPLINNSIISMGVYVASFTNEETIQFNLFENNEKKDKLRKTFYQIKDKFGSNKVMRAVEIKENGLLRDVIGFGSVKDLYEDNEDLYTIEAED